VVQVVAPCDGSRVPRSPDPDVALAAALKRLREERKITQETLAYNAGLSVGTLAASKSLAPRRAGIRCAGSSAR